MASYFYGNTRLRAKLSNFLKPETLESFSNLKSIPNLIASLSKSIYKKSIEEALTFSHGILAIYESLHIELRSVNRNLNDYYSGKPLELIHTALIQDDLNNLKGAIRGVMHHIELNEIVESFTPLGSISKTILTELAKSNNLDDFVSKIATFNLEISEPLIRLYSGKIDLNSSEIELELVKWSYARINNILKNGENKLLLRDFINVESDIVNLNILFRYVNSQIANKNFEDDFAEKLIDMGNIDRDEITSLSKLDSIDQIVKSKSLKNYKYYLTKALACYNKTNRLSEFENQMHIYQLKVLSGLPRLKPLGIGVPLGYIALKKNEVRNLRWIAKGIKAGFSSDFIKENLVFAK